MAGKALLDDFRATAVQDVSTAGRDMPSGSGCLKNVGGASPVTVDLSDANPVGILVAGRWVMRITNDFNVQASARVRLTV